jgi:hypothetical protein
MSQKKCCKVLLTWKERYQRFDKWKKSKAESSPPNTATITSSDRNLLVGRARSIVAKIPRTPANLIPGTDRANSPRNVKVEIDEIGTLQNPEDFNNKKSLTGSGRTEPEYIDDSGVCTRLSRNSSKECRCKDFSNGTPVEGSEDCSDDSLVVDGVVQEEYDGEELDGEEGNQRTSSISPKYKFGGVVKWQRYINGTGWRDDSEKIAPITVSKSPIPVNISEGRTVTKTCTIKVSKEMDCCQ